MEDALGVGSERFQCLEGRVRVGYPDELDLVELMHAYETPSVATIGAGFAAEARGMGAILHRKICRCQDLGAMEVHQRYF